MTERFFIQTDEVSGIEVPVSDRGLQYGDGFFETLRISDGKCALLPFHSERIKETAEALKFMPDSVTHVPAELLSQSLGEKMVFSALPLPVARGPEGYRYPSCTRVASQKNFSAFAVFSDLCSQRASLRAFTAYCLPAPSCPASPRWPGLKHLNRLDQVLAQL